jgi:arsenate reductase
MEPVRVLFVCTHNAARSQMAEAFLNHLADGHAIAESAGFEPGALNPHAVKVMAEAGIDISKNPTKSVFDLYKEGRLYSYVITVCSPDAAAKCPLFPGYARRLNWYFPDPASFEGSEEEILEKTRRVRDMIRDGIEEFVKTIKVHGE